MLDQYSATHRGTRFPLLYVSYCVYWRNNSSVIFSLWSFNLALLPPTPVSHLSPSRSLFPSVCLTLSDPHKYKLLLDLWLNTKTTCKSINPDLPSKAHMYANENKTCTNTHTHKYNTMHHKFKTILSRGTNILYVVDWFALHCSGWTPLTCVYVFLSISVFPVDLMWSKAFWRQIENSVQSAQFHPNMHSKGKQATIRHVIQMFLSSDANESFDYFILPIFFFSPQNEKL